MDDRNLIRTVMDITPENSRTTGILLISKCYIMDNLNFYAIYFLIEKNTTVCCKKQEKQDISVSFLHEMNMRQM